MSTWTLVLCSTRVLWIVHLNWTKVKLKHYVECRNVFPTTFYDWLYWEPVWWNSRRSQQLQRVRLPACPVGSAHPLMLLSLYSTENRRVSCQQNDAVSRVESAEQVFSILSTLSTPRILPRPKPKVFHPKMAQFLLLFKMVTHSDPSHYIHFLWIKMAMFIY